MKKSYLLGMLLAGAMTLGARADIIPTFTGTTASGSNFQWNYAVSLTVAQTLVQGSYFTIYDFGAPIGPTIQPTGWVFSSSLVGQTPATVLPTDNASIYNLTWTYTGSTVVGAASLGTFSAVSATDRSRTANYTGSALNTINGAVTANIGSTSVPVPEMSALLPMVGVCGFGAIGLASSFLRRRQKQ